MTTHRAQSWISRNYRAFDGLRGVAVMMVFAIHYGYILIPARYTAFLWTGVDLFFVLSGFLITGILWDSADSKTYYRDFYTRRALRIFPLYYGFFLAVAALTPLLHLHYDPILWTNLVYLSNFTVAYAPTHNPTIFMIGNVIHHVRPTVILGVLWSLCVEEHFYLVWPFVVRWAQGRRRLMLAVCLAGVVVVMAIRIAIYRHDPAASLTSTFLYRASFTRFDTLLLGASLAIFLREYRLTARRFRTIAWGSVILGTSSVLIGLCTFGRRFAWDFHNPVISTYGYTAIGIAAVGILMLAIDESSALSRVLRNRHLAQVGVVSYGIYFMHELPVQAIDVLSSKYARWHVGIILVPMTFLTTYFAARWSYVHYESYFLRLKDRLAPPVAHSSHPPPVASSVTIAA